MISDSILMLQLKREKLKLGPDKSIHLFNSQFYSLFMESNMKGYAAGHERVARFASVHLPLPTCTSPFSLTQYRWTKNVDIFKQEFIFIPVFEDFHFTLVVIVRPCEVMTRVKTLVITSAELTEFPASKPTEFPPAEVTPSPTDEVGDVEGSVVGNSAGSVVGNSVGSGVLASRFSWFSTFFFSSSSSSSSSTTTTNAATATAAIANAATAADEMAAAKEENCNCPCIMHLDSLSGMHDSEKLGKDMKQ